MNMGNLQLMWLFPSAPAVCNHRRGTAIGPVAARSVRFGLGVQPCPDRVSLGAHVAELLAQVCGGSGSFGPGGLQILPSAVTLGAHVDQLLAQVCGGSGSFGPGGL